jgi:regulator of protease activity HflC (stomatin/prohibitin superfamily)
LAAKLKEISDEMAMGIYEGVINAEKGAEIAKATAEKTTEAAKATAEKTTQIAKATAEKTAEVAKSTIEKTTEAAKTGLENRRTEIEELKKKYSEIIENNNFTNNHFMRAFPSFKKGITDRYKNKGIS